MTTFKKGDKVEWNTSQGKTRGTVEGTVTSETHIKGYTAKASPAHPEVKVRSDKSGKPAVHRADALHKAR